MNIKTTVTYAVSTALMILAAMALSHAGLLDRVAQVYVPIAFLVVAGLDFYRSQVIENGQSEVAAYAGVFPPRTGVYLDRYHFVRVTYFGETIPGSDQPLVPADASSKGGSSFTDRLLLYAIAAPVMLPGAVYLATPRQRG